MLRPEELPESRAGTTDEASWARRLDRCPTPPPGEEVGAEEGGAEQRLPRPGGGPSAGERGAGSVLITRESRSGRWALHLRLRAPHGKGRGNLRLRVPRRPIGGCRGPALLQPVQQRLPSSPVRGQRRLRPFFPEPRRNSPPARPRNSLRPVVSFYFCRVRSVHSLWLRRA